MIFADNEICICFLVIFIPNAHDWKEKKKNYSILSLQYIKVINFQENQITHNPNYPHISDQPCEILIIGGFGSGKTNTLPNISSTRQWQNLCICKGSKESKYQLLIKKTEDADVKHYNDQRAFIEFSNPIDNVYNNINDYNPNRNHKMLPIFDNMIADMNIIFLCQKMLD